MTNDSPLWAFEGVVIPEVANFQEEGLVTPEGWEGEKGILKKCWFIQARELNPSLMKRKSANHYTIQRLLWKDVD